MIDNEECNLGSCNPKRTRTTAFVPIQRDFSDQLLNRVILHEIIFRCHQFKFKKFKRNYELT